ncbi:uncharacterized protein LOC117652976 [Thrips palmi]|uniref:Uncharacterized protein LOC117652976 n=1 Tax=Thrips palmi TaxID=161013 RepID=A0A6P9A822_THRPL|nr:uncharacterized protein LOC117652976 [Thrips palmi]
MFTLRFDMGPSSMMSHYDKLDLDIPVDFGDNLVETSWVDFKGTVYRPGMIVYVGSDDVHSLPVFGKINSIICNEDCNVGFIYQKFNTIGLYEDYAAYEIVDLDSSTFVNISDLISHAPVIYHQFSDGKKFVALRYDV